MLLRAEMERLRGQGAEAHARIGELITQVAKANELIGELLAIAQRKKRGVPQARPPEPPAPPNLADDQRVAFEHRPRPALASEPPPEKKKPARPTGRKPLPAYLPVVEGISTPPCCAACQCTRLQVIDEVIEEKLDVVAHQRIRRTRRKTCRCQDCGARTIGEAPPLPFPRSKVSCEWLAWLAVQKFQLAVPLDRVRRDLGVQGVALAMSFLVSMTEKAADLLDAIDGEHWKQLLAGDHLASEGPGSRCRSATWGCTTATSRSTTGPTRWCSSTRPRRAAPRSARSSGSSPAPCLWTPRAGVADLRQRADRRGGLQRARSAQAS